MSTMERSFGVGAARAVAIFIAMAATSDVRAGHTQAAVDDPIAASPRARTLYPSLSECDPAKRGAEHFIIQRPNGGTRIIDICGGEDRVDLSTRAQTLSLALDAAVPSSRITSDPRMLAKLLGLQVMRSRADIDVRMDAETRSRKLSEIDEAIKVLEVDISRAH